MDPLLEDLTRWQFTVHTAPPRTWSADAIAQHPRFREALPQQPIAGGLATGELSIVLAASDSQLALLHTALRPAPTVTLALQIATLPAPATVVFSGTLQRIHEVGGLAILHIQSAPAAFANSICRDAQLIGLAPDCPRPQPRTDVFGRRPLRAVPLFSTRQFSLAAPLPIAATSLALSRPLAATAPVTLQITEEILTASTISLDGLTLTGLTRPDPHDHDRGATAIHRPAGTLRWCFADHEAIVSDIRFANGDSLDPSAITAAPIAEASHLPLFKTYALGDREIDYPRATTDWQLATGNTIPFGLSAFVPQPSASAAFFIAFQPTLVARWIGNLAISERRYDDLRRAELRFEFTEPVDWGASTRLRVRLAKGARMHEVDLDRTGRVATLISSGAVTLPAQRPSEAGHPVRLGFDAFLTTGIWANPTRALDGHEQEPAAASGAATLSAVLQADRHETAWHLAAPKLCARVRNTGAAAATVSLAVDLDPQLTAVVAVELAPGETRRLVLPFAIPAGEDSTILFDPALTYQLSTPAGSTIELDEIWLEAIHTPPTGIIGNETGSTTAPVEIATFYDPQWRQAAIPLDLLLTENDWAFFSTEGGDLIISITLVMPPAIAGWSLYVRNVGWHFTLRQCTSVRPRTDLLATVDGIATRDDGTADPVATIQALLTQARFANEAAGSLRTADFLATAARSETRDLALARVLTAGHHTIAETLDQIAREAGLALSREETRWRLQPTETAATTIPDSQIEDLPQTHHQATSPLTRQALRDAEGVLILTEPGTAPIQAHQLQWLVRTSAMPTFTDARETTIAVSPAHLPKAPDGSLRERAYDGEKLTWKLSR